MELEERFWSKVVWRVPDGECWEWQAKCHKSGYGQFWVKDTMAYSHRVAYELEVGEIPDELEIGYRVEVRHKCDNPPCVNPEHLEIGSHTDNMRDNVERGRHWQKNKTHCPSNHPYADENTFRRRGERECRTCMRDREQERRRKGNQS